MGKALIRFFAHKHEPEAVSRHLKVFRPLGYDRGSEMKQQDFRVGIVGFEERGQIYVHHLQDAGANGAGDVGR